MKYQNLKAQGGIALLEAMIAAVILAIGLLGTVGMQARSYAALADASMRAEATIAADKLFGIMSNDRPNLGQYAVKKPAKPSPSLGPWAAETSERIPGANYEVTVTPMGWQSEVKIVISWQRRKEDAPNNHTLTSYIPN